MGAKNHEKKKGVKGNIQKALRVGAAYGILASGAYGTYSAISSRPVQAQEAPLKEKEPFVWEWSDSKTYEAQNKFLKLVHSAYQNGNAPVKKFVAAVNDSYAKGREDLGKMFDGQMDEKVTTLELVFGEDTEDSGICLTISYKPNAGSKLAACSAVRVKYFVGTCGDVNANSLYARETPLMKATLVAWQGFNEEKKAWEDVKIPEEMQPTVKKAASPEDPNCSYPRWNPQGAKYGFVGRRRLLT
jgi:hypothetical protein